MKYPKRHGVCVNRRKAYVRNAHNMETRAKYNYYMYSPVAELETEYLNAVETVAYNQRMVSEAHEEWAYGYVDREDFERIKSELETSEVEMEWLAKALRNYK